MTRIQAFGTERWKNIIGRQLAQEREKRKMTLQAVCRGIGCKKCRSPEIGCLERNKIWNWSLLQALLKFYCLTLELVPKEKV